MSAKLSSTADKADTEAAASSSRCCGRWLDAPKGGQSLRGPSCSAACEALAPSRAAAELARRPWQQIVGGMVALQVLTMIGYHLWAVPPGPPWNSRTVFFGPGYTQEFGHDVDSEDVVYFYMKENCDGFFPGGRNWFGPGDVVCDGACDAVFGLTTVRFLPADESRWQDVPLTGDCTLSREFSGFRRVGLFRGMREGSYEVESSQAVYWLQQSDWDAQDASWNYWLTMGLVLLLPLLAALVFYTYYVPRQGEVAEDDVEMALSSELKDPSAWKEDLPDAWKQAAGLAQAGDHDAASPRSPRMGDSRSAVSNMSAASPRGLQAKSQSKNSMMTHKEGVTTWKYSPANKKNIASRQTPDISGAQTRHVIRHGDVFRVVEERKGNNGVVFLRLEGDRGWLFDQKPGIGVMCVKQEELPARSAIPPKSQSRKSLKTALSRKSLSTVNTGLSPR